MRSATTTSNGHLILVFPDYAQFLWWARRGPMDIFWFPLRVSPGEFVVDVHFAVNS